MLSNHYVTKLINLEGIKFKEIYIQKDEVRILVVKDQDIEVCPKCLKATNKLVDTTAKVYRDLNILNRICFIEIDHRRFECRNCFNTFMESIPFIRPYRRYTNRFEKEVYECCKETNATYAASRFGISDHAAAEIYEWHAKQKLEELKLDQEIEEIGIDEIAMHKGHHDFILVITNLNNKKVIEVLTDRKKETLESYLKGWGEELKNGIKAVAIDLSSPYRSAVEKHLPNAFIVADRFHVMQNLNKALDECRKQEKNVCGNKEDWKDAKYAVLKNKENLTEEQKSILNKILNISPILKLAYDLKERFREIFNQTTI
jgi:transposase